MKNILNTIALTGAMLLSPALNAGDYSSGKEPYGKEVIPACDAYYIELFGGFSLPDPNIWNEEDYAMDEGWNAGASIGTGLTDRIDIEFEAFYTNADYITDQTELRSLGLMVNAFYDIPLGEKLTAYVGGGVGALHIDVQDGDSSSWEFGYQAVGGLRYAITPCMDVFTEYRFVAASQDDIGPDDVDFHSNDVSVGVRLKF